MSGVKVCTLTAGDFLATVPAVSGPDRTWVRTPPAERGQTLTSGAVSTGIDLALQLVARLDSVGVAGRVAGCLGYALDLVG